ncbi:hypothetical protein RhiirA4_484094 [Rhizophagus irregularis]|uniref:Uncharacterized protein n=1 Tax=Rhizophagus irregularis TaxID=588596 RepID=A0A2I1HNF0_9GLOM|nr:hypothetical protein RhiirA4_484094 [Rhizophagus irregularis]
MVTRLNNSEMTKEWHVLYITIDIFSETEIKLTNHLISNMHYSKGKRQGQILSAHLQNKLKKKNFDALHQIKLLDGKLGYIRKKQNNQISKVPTNVRRKKSFSCNSIKLYLNSLFLNNKRHYNNKAIVLNICLSQIGRISFHDTIHYMRIIIECLTNEYLFKLIVLFKLYEIHVQKLHEKKNNKRNKINEIINNMDKSKLDNTLKMVTRFNDSEITKECNMRYSKGKRQGQILSAHLQNKAAKFIESSIYKSNSSTATLTKENTSLKK